MNAIRVVSIPLMGAVGAVGLTAAFVARGRFVTRVAALDRRLADAQNLSSARADLPAEVAQLAARLGANAVHPARYVDMRQSGTMWFKPGGAPQNFTARQRTGTSRSGFVWYAGIGPLSAISVVDSLVEGRGFLEARVFGVFGVARIDGTANINQGEGLRYLAELPLNPDAILFDHSLDWWVDGPKTIRVANGVGESRAEITFELDEAGLIRTASAASRAFDAVGTRHPWRGRFWDYQVRDGRRVPVQAEVAWVIDGADFIYWRGKIESWTAIAAPIAAE